MRTLLGLVLALVCVPAFTESLQVFGDEAYAPVIWNDQGTPRGILPAVLRRIEDLTGDRFPLTLAPWRRAYVSGESGLGGVIGLSSTDERRKIFDYSRPIYHDDIQIIVRKGQDFPFRSLADLRGKTFGGVLGASYGQTVDEAIKSGLFTVDRDGGQVSRMKKLLAGRLDGAFIGNGQLGLILVMAGDPVLAAASNDIVALPRPLVDDPLSLGVPKSLRAGALLDRFDRALESLRASGELGRIIKAEGKAAP